MINSDLALLLKGAGALSRVCPEKSLAFIRGQRNVPDGLCDFN